MGKLADRIFFGSRAHLGLFEAPLSLCLAFKQFIGKLADRIFLGSRAFCVELEPEK